ncbi:hypothetical protein Tco_1482314, partial [Tanacetum coccineum]
MFHKSKKRLNQNPPTLTTIINSLSDGRLAITPMAANGYEDIKMVALKDVASDLTLSRTKAVRCAHCGHREAIFFQSRLKAIAGLRQMQTDH